jgi:hypothetical protein
MKKHSLIKHKKANGIRTVVKEKRLIFVNEMAKEHRNFVHYIPFLCPYESPTGGEETGERERERGERRVKRSKT